VFLVRKIESPARETVNEILDKNTIADSCLENCKKKWFRGYEAGLSLWRCDKGETQNLICKAAVVNFVPNKDNINNPTYLVILKTNEFNDFNIKQSIGGSILQDYNDLHYDLYLKNEDQVRKLVFLFSQKIKNGKDENFMQFSKVEIETFIRQYGYNRKNVQGALTDKQRQLLYG
jgi:hypothetical protein